MDRQTLIQKIRALQEPAQLEAMLRQLGDQFDSTVAEILKDHIDQVNRADPRLALAFAKAGLSAAEACSKDTVRARMLWARGHAQVQLEDYRSGLASCDLALEILETLGEEHAAARVQVSRLFALLNLGQEEEVIRQALQIRPVLEKYSDQFALARLDMNVGIAYDDTDRHQQALYCFDAAADRFQKLQRPLEMLRARINAAIALENLDRYDDALALYTQIRPALAALDKSMVLARNDFNMAVLHFWLGDYALALEEFERACRMFQELDVPAEMDQVDLYRAMLYLELNLFGEVVETCEKVERRASTRGITRDVVLAKRLAGLARGYRHWPEDWETALALLKEARSVAEERDTPLQVAQIDLDIALLLLERGLPDQALPLTIEVLEHLAGRDLPAKLARAQIVCGRCLLALGQPAQAEAHFQAALAVAERLALIQLAFRCHYYLGQIAETAGNRKQARQHYDRAIHDIELLRRQILVDDFRSSFLEDKLSAYTNAARLCLEENDIEAAFDYVERAKARVLLDLIASSVSSTTQGEPEAAAILRQQLYELERRWNALQHRQLPDPREPQDRDSLASMGLTTPQQWQDLAELERQMLSLRRKLQLLSPTSAGLSGEAVLGLLDLQQQLGPDVTLLEYFVVGDRLVAFVITHTDCHLQALEAGAAEVTRTVRELLTDLQDYQLRWGDPIMRRLNALYNHLIQPICDLLGAQRLLLVPHGSLYHVPFAALHNGEQFFVESFECSYAPSATVHMLGQNRLSSGTKDVVLAFSGAGQILSTLKEATQIAAVLPEALTFCENDATMANLHRHCDQARLLHLATHGSFRGDNPLFSTLQLADVDLTVRQVYDLHLSASLVTLSACETGQSYLQGNDLIGLTGAFLYAGAASLVVSLWQVQDESTAQFMQRFYQQLSQGQSKAAALRAAQMELLASEQFGAPFYWAPFVLYGDTGVLETGVI